MKNKIEYFFFLVLVYFVRLFSFHTVQKIGMAFGSFAYSVLGIRKELTTDNIRKAFPEKSEQEISAISKETYKNLFAAFFEIFVLDTLSEEKIRALVSFPESHKINEALQKGKGLILLSGHFGNWELTALATPLFAPQKYSIVVKKQRNPYVDAFMNRMRARFGTNVLIMERAPREILKALSKNEVVALLADQSAAQESLFIDFLGRPAATYLGPAVFALRAQAPMLMLMLVRKTDGTFAIEANEIDTENLSGSEEEKLRNITEQHVRVLEKYIRHYPEQWLWMHKRWKHTETYLRKLKEQQSA
jgi:KDO2-lipid IV(A) lauroyltransferase